MDELLMERHFLNQERLKAILQEDSVKEPFLDYFRKMAERLLFADEVYGTKDKQLFQLKEWNKEWYEQILPSEYDVCYGNPDYARNVFGEEFGDILCFLYAEIQGCFVYAVEGQLFELTIMNELFLEIYQLFLEGMYRERRQNRSSLTI